ncbi:MAG: hypothetical protein ABI761_19130 [Saprospiraceae bacterium]
MKKYSILVFCLLILFACKPDITIQSLNPEIICGCQQGEIVYKLENADRSWVELSPAGASSGTITSPVARGEYKAVSFMVCDNATVTVFAENSKGQSSKSSQVRRVTTIEPIKGTLHPMCVGNRFDGWDFLPGHIEGDPSALPATALLTEVIVTVDRTGTFTYMGTSVIIYPGPNSIKVFAGQTPFGGNYHFTAPLNFHEQCAETGTALPSGTKPPGNFTIVLNTVCP